MKEVYKNRKYEIISYDPEWPKQFEFYAEKVRKIFGNDVQIEHIGSTSVPQMSGKSCIDLLVILDDLKVIEGHKTQMIDAGFVDAGHFVMKDSYLFRAMNGNEVLANIHFFPTSHSHVVQMIAVRDFLRKHPEEVTAYSKMKDELFVKFSDNYSAYRENKDKYMQELIKRALASNMKNERARALILKDDKILMIQRLRVDSEYYVLPGGHLEDGELPEITVMREVKEETSLEVKLVKKLESITDKDGTIHHIYLCEYISGKPNLTVNSPEVAEASNGNIYTPMWIEIGTLQNLQIWPAEAKAFLLSYCKRA